jgi:limonene-1,2-epoxide hydrolase
MSGMNERSALDVAMEFVGAINQQDADRLVELMTVDHQFTDSLGNTVRGSESMREGWKLYFQMVPDYQVRVEETFVNGPTVLLLGMAGGTYSHGFESVMESALPNAHMPDGSSKYVNKWQTPAALRARIEGGKVAEWRVYADNEPIRRLMKGEVAEQRG